MRRAALSVVVAILLPPGAASAATPAKPARVASLNLTADEILVDILPPERLVSVTRHADAQGTSNIVGRVRPGVFRFQKADMEKLVALAPDLVVVSEYTDADFLRLVERSGLRYHRMRGLDSFPGFRQAILDLGAAVGEPQGALRLVARYDAVLAELGRRLKGAERPRVLYWASGLTAGAKTAIGALIEGAGARNVGAELRLEGFAPIGAERAFIADPDVVLIGTWPGTKESLLAHPLLAEMRAVKAGRVIELPTERLVALSHYAADACWALAAALHPDRVPKAIP
jgi:iron complex transport system substrate-binding protein